MQTGSYNGSQSNLDSYLNQKIGADQKQGRKGDSSPLRFTNVNRTKTSMQLNSSSANKGDPTTDVSNGQSNDLQSFKKSMTKRRPKVNNSVLPRLVKKLNDD